MNIRKNLYAFLLLLRAFGSIATVSQSAYSKKDASGPRAQIDNFYVTPVPTTSDAELQALTA